MLVGQSGKVVMGSRDVRLGIPLNDPINRFIGTVSNLWNNPANWSLGNLPTSNQTVVLDSSVQLINNVVIRALYKNQGFTINKNGFTIKNGSGVDLE